ncbi:hypothetical protein JW905_03885 [bacterium]|nr:hypothetical protein [candidate division CSSED10-310 bacterium]
MNGHRGWRGLAAAFSLAALAAIVATEPCRADNYRHVFTWTGSFGLVGFDLENEYLAIGRRQDDSGFLVRYDLGFTWRYRDLAGAALRVAAEGQSRYAIPIGTDRETFFGTYEKLDASDLLPRVDEVYAWLNNPGGRWRAAAGILRFLDKDKYANPGVTLGYFNSRLAVTMHYEDLMKRGDWFCQPMKLTIRDIISDRQDAYYTAMNAALSGVSWHLNMTGEWLVDETPAATRVNGLESVWGMVDHDELGTGTLAGRVAWHGWHGEMSAAMNFGGFDTISGTEPSERYGYTGRRLDAAVGYTRGIWSLRAGHTTASGQPWPAPESGRIPRNYQGFAHFPPTDLGMYNAHYRKEDGPKVLGGGTLTPFYGVPRPGFYFDSFMVENMQLDSLRLTLEPLPDWTLQITGWWMAALETPYSWDGAGWTRLDRDLGRELDIECVWNPRRHLQIRGFWGWYRTGGYHEDSARRLSPLRRPDDPWRALGDEMVQLAEVEVAVWR